MIKIESSWIQSNIHKFINKNVVIITGAGISVKAGIPDFRSKTGIFSDIYKKFKIKGEDLFTYKFGLNDSTRHIYINYIYNLKKLIDNAKPTFTHNFFKWYQNKCNKLRVYTQNIDGLEEKGGFKDSLVYLHGNLKYLKCIRCGSLEEFNDVKIEKNKHLNLEFFEKKDNFGNCKKCEISIKRHNSIQTFLHTTIVHYYQDHPNSDFISKCIRDDSFADLCIVVGTSLNVFGVRNMIKYFYKMKCECFFVNIEDCRNDMKKYFKYLFKGSSDEFFSKIKEYSNIDHCNLSFSDISILRDVMNEERIEKRMKRLSLTKDEITNNFLFID